MSHDSGVPWHLVESYKKQFSAKAEHRLLGAVEGVLAQEMQARNDVRDKVSIHPSEMAKTDWCPRNTYYRITGEEESDPEHFTLRRMNIFAEGHYIHDKWQTWMWKAGGLVGLWRCTDCGHGWMDQSPFTCPECHSARLAYREVPIYNDEHKIIGHADGEWVDSKGRALVELKSVGLGTIRWDAPKLYEAYEKGDIDLDGLWKRIKRPLLAHRKQIMIYMYCRGLTEAIVIYEWKPTQEVKEFHITYDHSMIEPLLVNNKLILNALEDGIPPRRPDEARNKSCKMCKFCVHKTTCWKAKT